MVKKLALVLGLLVLWGGSGASSLWAETQTERDQGSALL
jgi:hypothetical protein